MDLERSCGVRSRSRRLALGLVRKDSEERHAEVEEAVVEVVVVVVTADEASEAEVLTKVEDVEDVPGWWVVSSCSEQASATSSGRCG